jgi:endonuclease-3
MIRHATRPSPRRSKTAAKLPATPAKTEPALKRQAAKVIRHLAKDYPDVTCALENETPFQLLVATILSAQCTDARVNMVTPDVFRRWPDAAAMAAAPIRELEKAIQSTGFFRNKAKNIKAASQALMEKHDGELPQDLPGLIALPGVGRKTANVVLGTAFGVATGVVVDTHVTRISRRRAGSDAAGAAKGMGQFRPPHDPPRPPHLHRPQAKVPGVFDEEVLPENRRSF